MTLLALQTLVVVTLRGGPIEVGWLNAARWLPYLVFGPVVGGLVDRIRRRPVMVTTDLTRAVVLAVIPVAWLLDVLTFPLLLFVVLAFGTVTLVNDAASMSFAPRRVLGTEPQRAHARLDAADAVYTLPEPCCPRALIRIVGAPLAGPVDAVTYLFSAAMVATLRQRFGADPFTPHETASPSARRGDPRRRTVGLRRIGARPVGGSDSYLARRPGGAAVRVALYSFLQLDLSAFQLGLVYAFAGVGALVGAELSTRVGDSLGSGGAIICTYAVSSIGAVVMLTAALRICRMGRVQPCSPRGSSPTAGVWAASATLTR